MQTWVANSLSRCNSKFRFISSNDSPLGELEGLKTHAHSEQAQPVKRWLCTDTISRGIITTLGASRYVFIKLPCFVARWLASSSSLRADSAKRGHAISFVTLATVALATFSFAFLFLLMINDVILREAMQSNFGHSSFLPSNALTGHL